jgi:hypothetical protein
MAAVRPESHTRFAQENEMASFLMSAKNGDQVNKAFWKITCTLAGVTMNKTDLESKGAVVPAQIIDHQRYLLPSLSPPHDSLCRHDPNVNEGEVPEYTKRTGCVVS